jgi:hypothetical protein
MQFVPENRADETEGVSHGKSDDDEREGRFRIERFDHIDRNDRVGPENEIDGLLRIWSRSRDREKSMAGGTRRCCEESFIFGDPGVLG